MYNIYIITEGVGPHATVSQMLHGILFKEETSVLTVQLNDQCNQHLIISWCAFNLVPLQNAQFHISVKKHNYDINKA